MFQSRAAAFYANTSYLGLHNQGLWVSIAGSLDVSGLLDLRQFVIELHARQPSVCEFVVPAASAVQVKAGHSIEVRNGGPAGALIFAGTCVSRRILTTSEHRETTDVVMAMDNTWLLDRWKFVDKRYENQAFSAIIHDLITSFTDPNSGFTPGLIEATGTITIDCRRQRVSECLRRLAACTGTIPQVTASKEVSLRSIGSQTLSIGASADEFIDIEIEEDLSQTRTRVFVEGEGSQLSADYAPNATTMAVSDTTWASTSGGSARVRGGTFTYTGKTDDALTGVSGAPMGYEGDGINLVVQADDATAQSTLASILGGSQSGIVEFYIVERESSLSEATARANDELYAGSFASLPTVEFTTRNRTLVPGQYVQFSATKIGTNRFFTNTLEIDSIRLSAVGDAFVDGDQPPFLYTVQCSPAHTSLSRMLSRSIDSR